MCAGFEYYPLYVWSLHVFPAFPPNALISTCSPET